MYKFLLMMHLPVVAVQYRCYMLANKLHCYNHWTPKLIHFLNMFDVTTGHACYHVNASKTDKRSRI